MNTAKKSKIRTLFIVLLLFLPLQYGYVGVMGEIKSEPWPAFVFPGFKSVYSTDESIQIKQHLFRVHSDNQGSVREVQPQELFPELPLSQIPGFMRTHFQEPLTVKNMSDDAIIWLYRLSEEYSGEYTTHIEIVIRTNRYVNVDDGIMFESVMNEELIPIPRPGND